MQRGTPFTTVHWELAAQNMLAHGLSQMGPWFGSGQTQTFSGEQKALLGQSLFTAHCCTERH